MLRICHLILHRGRFLFFTDDVPDVTAIGAFLGLTLASLVVANVIIFR